MAAPMQKVQMRYLDWNGNEARSTMYVPLSLSEGTLISALNTLLGFLNGITNGVIPDCSVSYTLDFVPPSEASIDSDVGRMLVLFYRNETEIEALYIPSPPNSLFETEGKYAGIRVDPTGPAILPYIEDAPDLFSILSTPEGTPFPTVYVVGGLVL